MKVLVTGHQGYIGSVLVPFVIQAGHDVVGLDTGFYEECAFGADRTPGARATIALDLRDVEVEHLVGFDAVMHLAALSNDPVGNINPENTFAINHRASVRLAEVAKRAGVPRFVFASSCSLYGVAGDAMLTEEAAFNPITAYGESKVRVEQAVSALADNSFSPTFLRNATAYGASPRLRADVVVNNLVGIACTTGEIVVQSDGTPWRPLVHIEDIARAFLAVLEAPREAVHNQAFNVGRSDENYRVRQLADLVQEVVPGSSVRYAAGGGPDPRCYRVNCDKIARALPAFRPQWTVRRGMEELAQAFRDNPVTHETFLSRYVRIQHLLRLQREGALDESLRWRVPALALPSPSNGGAP